MRIVVIGAGIMGCASALEIAARAGSASKILLLERAVPGAEASSAAAGMLAAQIEAHDDDEQCATYVRARHAYEGWAAELREQSGGIDIGYRRCGAIEVAGANSDGGVDAAKLSALVARQRALGLAAEMLDGIAARAIERELSPSIECAAYFADEAQVDPPQLLRALGAAIARTPSITTKSGATVSSIIEEGGRCVGVALDGGERLPADVVILAAGSWSSLVPGVPKSMPKVEPVRGQLVMLEERPPKMKTIVFMNGGYVVPRGDGRIVCGSTMENVGHRREVTAGGLQSILASAIAIAPSLAHAEMSRAWCNFRPHAKGGPLIGHSPLPGLVLATGHHRNGILLAKVTASLVADAVLSSSPSPSPLPSPSPPSS